MKVKEIKIESFRRFTDLKIHFDSKKIKLVVLAGPNGCGKSSLFDAFNIWCLYNGQMGGHFDPKYHAKQISGNVVSWNDAVKIAFFDSPDSTQAIRKAFYIRSAYRNDPEFTMSGLSRVGSALEDARIARLIDTDAVVSRNYQRLVSQSVEDLFGNGLPGMTFEAYRSDVLGTVRDAMKRSFPDLVVRDLGNPLNGGSFRFSKGKSDNFLYMNLSGGEKAAFDLILDISVKMREFDDTVFCIDEPEVHMNTRLQGSLLGELYNMIPDHNQLWISTHSIGMMRKARDIDRQNPGTVAFLDFEDRDFDLPQVLTPIKPSRTFWERVLRVALDDLSDLVAPSRIVICEGTSRAHGGGKNAHFDAQCYNKIFESEFPDTKFFGAGNSSDVESDRLALMEALKHLVSGTDIIRLIDRDDHSDDDVADKKRSGINVLSRRHIESYLFDDEVLKALCCDLGKDDLYDSILLEKRRAIEACVAQGKPHDDIKSASGLIFAGCKRILSITQGGNDSKAFMRSTLAPKLKPGMAVYDELKQSIFG